MTSIIEVYERRAGLLREAEAVWSELAQAMAELIPPSMAVFASEWGWIKSEVDGWWKLPEFLQHLVKNTKAGRYNDLSFREEDLESLGFSTFEGLEAGLLDLRRAWRGLVRIQIEKRDGDRWRVYFFAAEITNKRKQKRG
ncbi:hypothetical protein HY630_01270 [Candidatus Uhrbacteria bacterium]|nr:hypothetical protein [Candidatus Uhrbacteria bacterium]